MKQPALLLMTWVTIHVAIGVEMGFLFVLVPRKYIPGTRIDYVYILACTWPTAIIPIPY